MKKLIGLFSLLLATQVFGQVSPYSLSPDWYFGQGARLTFPTGNYPGSGSPTAAYKGTNTSTGVENSTSVSFTDGSIALYTNTMQAYSANPAATAWTDFVVNFTTQNTCAGSSTGGAVAFPDPASPNTAFYIVLANDITGGACKGQGAHLYRFTGTGNIMNSPSGSTLITPHSFGSEAITVSTDGAGGYWLIMHDKTASNTFRVWHFTSSVISPTLPTPTDYTVGSNVTSVDGVPADASDNGGQSYLKVSPCQDKIAYHSGGVIVVHSFNRSTGVVGAELQRVTTTAQGIGLEFSPDGNRIFYNGYGSGSGGQVKYFDIATGTSTDVSGATSWSLQLGPDGKIYTSPSGTSVGVISNPNTTPTYSTMPLAGGASTYRGLINIAWLTPQTPSITNTTTACDVNFGHLFKNYFNSDVSMNMSSFNWNFGDGNTATTATPSHTYATTGSYTVTLTAQDATCGHTWSASKVVDVTCTQSCTNGSTPTNIQVDRNLLCSNDGGQITLSASGSSIQWFETSCGTGNIGSGNSLTIAAPTVTTTYYARGNASGGSCSNSNCISITVTVNNPTTDPTAANVDRPNFCSNDNGQISLSVTGGSGTTLNWYTGNSCSGASIGSGNNFSLNSPNTNTTYSAHFETPGCANSACVSITVTTTNTPTPRISGNTTNCANTTLTFSTVDNSPNTYNWIFNTTGTGIITSPTNSFSVSINNGNANGQLIVEETANGCTGKDTVDIVIQTPQGITANAGANHNTCVSTTNLSGNDPSPYSGQWNLIAGAGNIANSNDNTSSISGITTFAEVEWVITGTCFVSKDTVIITFSNSSLSLTTGNQDDTICDGAPKDLRVTASGGSGDYTYHWTSSDNSINTTTNNPSLSVTPSSGTTIYIVMVSDDVESGCSSTTDSITVFSSATQELIIPNLVTPNGDEKNDLFELRDVNQIGIFPGISLEVSNRWGQSVYKNQNYDNSWSPSALADGVYYYYLKTGCGNQEYKGWLEVIR